MAGDGTVIEAAASRFRALREEAARAARERAVAAVTAAPDDPAAQERLEQAQDVVATIEERAAVRRSRSADTTTVTACATEPDALVQPRKDGAMRPSDKPGVLAHPSGLLVGQVVEPSHESATILPMLCPHEAIFGELPTTTLLDSGDHDVATLQLFVDLGRDVLCPAGPPPHARTTAAPEPRKLPKHLFVDQPTTDTSRCPEGRTLEARERGHNHDGLAFRRYRGVACKDCPQRARCTTGRTGRVLARDEGDDLKEAMTQILQNPVAQARDRRRSALVEPVFAGLRERRGLRRFRRRGLRGVAVEFALHGLADNLRKGQRLAARRRARRVVHSRGGPWCTPPRTRAPRACRRLRSTRHWGGSWWALGSTAPSLSTASSRPSTHHRRSWRGERHFVRHRVSSSRPRWFTYPPHRARGTLVRTVTERRAVSLSPVQKSDTARDRAMDQIPPWDPVRQKIVREPSSSVR